MTVLTPSVIVSSSWFVTSTGTVRRCYDGRSTGDVTDEGPRPSGGAVRGEPAKPRGGGLPDARLGQRGGRRGAGGLAPPQPSRGGRDRQPRRGGDDGRRAGVPGHGGLAHLATGGAPGPRPTRTDRGEGGRHGPRA